MGGKNPPKTERPKTMFSVIRNDTKKLAAYNKSLEEANAIAARWEGCGVKCKVVPNDEVPASAF